MISWSPRSPSPASRLTQVLLVFALGACTRAGAQIAVDDATGAPHDPAALVEQLFAGAGVDVVSVGFDGDSTSIGRFAAGATSVGLDAGIALTTGTLESGFGTTGVDSAAQAASGSTATSASDLRNLDALIGLAGDGSSRTRDAQRLVIRFRPRGNSISLRYVFASEEYDEYVCNEVRDAFGLFLSGPGIAGPYANGAENIALVPGTTIPVGINSVNDGNRGTAPQVPPDPLACDGTDESLAYSSLYVARTGLTSAHVFDGQTVALVAEASVNPCEEYVLAIEIADAEDSNFDSGLFLEAGSLTSPVVEVSASGPSFDATLAEGCDEGEFVFTLSAPQSSATVIPLTVIGTAAEGIDFDALPNSVTIPAGQLERRISVRSLADGSTEPGETVSVVVDVDACTTDTTTFTIVDRRILPVPNLVDTTICAGDSIRLDATVPLAVDPDAEFTSSNTLANDVNAVRSSFIGQPGFTYYNDLAVGGVAEPELSDGAVVEVCVDLTHDRTSDLELYLYAPDGRSVLLASGLGGSSAGGYQNTCFRTDAAGAIDDPAASPPFSGAYRPQGDLASFFGAGGPTNGDWRLQITDDRPGANGGFRSWSIRFAGAYQIAYAWAPASGLSCADCPSPLASPTTATTYTVTARDGYGCSETADVDVDIYDPIAAPTLNCDARFGELAYSWPLDPDAVRYEVSVDGAPREDIGLIDSFVVDSLGFGVSRALQLFVVTPCGENSDQTTCTTLTCSPYVASATQTPVSCFGVADGEVTASASGGQPPYTFAIGTRVSSSGVFDSLAAGSYPVDVLDANGCPAATSVTVGTPAEITTDVSVTEPSACGDPYVASVVVTAGGVGGVDYAWSDGQVGSTAAFFTSDTYQVVVTDANSCSSLDSAVVPEVAPLAATFTLSDATCAGANDATASAVAAGGYLPYEYYFDGAAVPTGSVSGLAPGTYTLEVRDRIGCRVDSTFTLGEPVALSVVGGTNEVSCFGGADAKAYANVSGGTPPYDYAWDDGTSADTLRGLAAGSYALTVTDANGCAETATIVVAEPAELTASLSADSVLCAGTSTGVLRALASGGRPPYTYAWSDGRVTTVDTLADLPAGNYTVTVTDTRDCRAVAAVRLDEPAPLQVSGIIQPLACAEGTDGAIDLRVTGGTEPYAFAWDDGAVVEDRSGLSAGTYGVTVIDANGCREAESFTLDAPAPLRLSAVVRDVTCFARADGQVLAQLTGGGGGYTYEWTGPNGYAFFRQDPSGLDTGTYRLTYRDDLGCQRDTAFEIGQPELLTVATTAGDTICARASDGRAWATPSGGNAGYAYRWDNGEVADTATALLGGRHTVEVVDHLGCTATGSVFVEELAAVSLTLAQDPIRCYGDSNGVARVAAVRYGETEVPIAAFDYAWDGYPTEDSPVLSGLGGRQLAIATAVDARGCLGTGTITIGEPAELVASADVLSEVSCAGSADATARAEVRGGTEPYSYAWTNSAASGPAVGDLPAGAQELTVTDANGCIDVAALAVVEPDSLAADVTVKPVNCFSPTSGEIDVELAGGTTPYSYLWEDGRSASRQTELAVGTYLLEVTDARGCPLDVVAEVTAATDVIIEGAASPVSCAGDGDGRILVSASGGTGGHAFQLGDGPATAFGDFRNLLPGAYRAVAKDRDGCPSDTLALEVAEPDTFSIDIGEEVAVELGDQVELASEVRGAAGEVSYVWQPGDSTLFSCLTCPSPTLTASFEGVVAVYAVDANGCEAEDFLRVRISKSLLAAVPTGFTPNDDGVDDRLLVHGKTGTRVVSFEVFDRWGERVWADGGFAVNDVTRGWDGSFRGAAAPPGTYLWRADVVYLDGVAEALNGQTTLIR